jgi:hypothetical protein
VAITPRPSQYLMPPMDASESDKKGWLTEQKETGESYLKQQRAWPDIDRSIDLISGSASQVPRGMSRVSVNMVKRDVREAVATLANMRPLWGYKTDNDDYQKQSTVLNKMLRAWYYQPFVRQSIRDALQYAAGAGLGWISPVWASDQIIAGRGDIALNVYGPTGVLPYGIGKDHDIQKAYAVTIRVETPIQQAMAMYPADLDKMIPVRGSPTWMRKGTRRVQKFVSPLLNAFGQGQGKEKDESPFPTVDIFHTYILDLSINETAKDIWMGQPGTKWYYKVPSRGSKIQTGMYDNGQPTFRDATFEDSRLFPLRRLVIWTEQGILYDNTSMWWHGKVPLIPFRTDGWVWDFLGYSMARDGGPLQESANRLLRALDDSANVKLDMPLAYDENAMGQGLMERINPRKPGQRLKVNMQQNEKPIHLIVPAEYYSMDAWVAGMPEKEWEVMHHLLGTRDIQALAKARQVPSGDSIEKLMELAGPIVADMSSSMEGSMMGLGEMWKGLAMEFFDVKRRVQVLGQDGFTEEDYDFDPGNMIPSHLPDEMEKIKQHQALAKANGTPYAVPDSRASVVERARVHLNSFYFYITPSSLHQITQLTKKMLMMQLWKIGFPIDPWSVAEAMDLDNYGNPAQLKKILGIEDIADDKFGRWLAWIEMKMKMAPQAPQKGRPASGQTAPAVTSKDGGARSTVRESPR